MPGYFGDYNGAFFGTYFGEGLESNRPAGSTVYGYFGVYFSSQFGQYFGEIEAGPIKHPPGSLQYDLIDNLARFRVVNQ